MTGTNLIGDAAGVKALRGERFRSTQGRRTSLVEDEQSTRILRHVRCLRNPRLANIKRILHQTAQGELFLLRATQQIASSNTARQNVSPIRCGARLQQSSELAARTRTDLLRDRHPVDATSPPPVALGSPNGEP